jgi:ribosomal protein S18 acetylase RimI-like enzyme
MVAGYTITSDPARLDIDAIFEYLSKKAYWAAGRSRETIEQSITNSLCFGIFQGNQQVGFGRVVTDHATFAYLCDIYVLEEHRGRGLGLWLVESIMAALPSAVRCFLRTRDAHELYRRFGFETIGNPESYMVRTPRPL